MQILCNLEILSPLWISLSAKVGENQNILACLRVQLVFNCNETSPQCWVDSPSEIWIPNLYNSPLWGELGNSLQGEPNVIKFLLKVVQGLCIMPENFWLSWTSLNWIMQCTSKWPIWSKSDNLRSRGHDKVFVKFLENMSLCTEVKHLLWLWSESYDSLQSAEKWHASWHLVSPRVSKMHYVIVTKKP